jgi:limonene-1,2-epoxide hydrolase
MALAVRGGGAPCRAHPQPFGWTPVFVIGMRINKPLKSACGGRYSMACSGAWNQSALGAFHLGMMRSPDEVVTRFCALWSKPDLDEIASCLSEDAVYRNIPPTPPVEGREAIREFIAEFLATLDGIDFIVHRQVSDQGVVMHERTDVLRRKDGSEISVPIMGVFEIADGKIATWRDYFDTAITSAFI